MRSIDDPDISYSMSVHTNQQVLITGTLSEKIKMWDFRCPNALFAEIHEHNDTVSSVTVRSDGRRALLTLVVLTFEMVGLQFMSSSFDGCVRVWDMRSARCIRTLCKSDGIPM